MTEHSNKGPVSRPRPPWARTATRDAIRHFAWGIGDNNPLWLDPNYACETRWGGLIAPPCFLYAVDETTVASGYPNRRRLYRSVDWTFYDVIRAGNSIEASARLLDETGTNDAMEQSGQVDFRLVDGTRIARAATRCLRPASSAIAVEDRPELRYTGEELEAIERSILQMKCRGSDSRFWEDTEIGEELGTLVKGPLSIMDIVAWCAATTGVIDDSAGHSEGGLHVQTATGPEQVAWIAQLITDWMGDDAFLHRLSVELNGCPPLGAKTSITGRVTSVELVERRPAAQLELTSTDQSGAKSACGTAVVLLPSSRYGPVTLPIEP